MFGAAADGLYTVAREVQSVTTLQKFIDKVERAIADFVETGPEASDPTLLRLKREEEDLLDDVKSMNMARAGRSFFTCASVFGMLVFAAIGQLTAWPAAIMVLLGMTTVTAAVNGWAGYGVRRQLDELVERHDALLQAMDRRRKRRAQLTSSSQGEALVMALDELDERLPTGTDEARRSRDLVRQRLRTLRRDRVVPLLNHRERRARYLLDQDPDGLAKEIQEALQRQAEHEADLDMESGMILERTLTAKRETLDKLADADREFSTIELTVESLQSQVANIKAVVAQGNPEAADEVLRLLDELDRSLDVAPGVAPRSLPPGTPSSLPPSE